MVEALFGYEDSKAVVRYILSKHSTAIDIEVRLYWNEKQKMVKLEIPSLLDAPQCIRPGGVRAGKSSGKRAGKRLSAICHAAGAAGGRNRHLPGTPHRDRSHKGKGSSAD